MAGIALKYGKTSILFEYDENQLTIIGDMPEHKPLSDVEIGARFDRPIGSKILEEIVSPGESVLLVVPDATRQTASGQIVNLLVRRLIANGTLPYEITIVFATGIHRRVTDEEKREILTPFIAQRIKTIDHNARDLATLVNLGETSGGIPVQMNRALVEHDRIIIVGGVAFHYFAGFTGGRKLICPGLASSRTVSETHKLAFDCARKTRRDAIGTGILDGNVVHEAFVEVAAKTNPAFSVNTIVNERGEAIEIFCGDWIAAHRAACEFYARDYTLEPLEKRDFVIASCGGAPHDINMIQAHKTLDAAARVCRDGGTIILLAECGDGLGRKDFLDWLAAENSEKLAEKLCEKYQVNGQTAWNLLRIAEKFDVRMITALDETETRPMRIQKARSLDAIVSDRSASGYIMPFGAKFTVKEN